MPSSMPKGGSNTEKRESTSGWWNWERFNFGQGFKLRVAKEVGFRHMEVRKMDMLGRRNNIIKDTEIENPPTYIHRWRNRYGLLGLSGSEKRDWKHYIPYRIGPKWWVLGLGIISLYFMEN